MKYLRIYADADGESHFEEVNTTYTPIEPDSSEPSLEVAAPIEATRCVMAKCPKGWTTGFHPAPRRQLCSILNGELECIASDGTTERLKSGDTLLLEDTVGKGHQSKVIGDNDAVAIFIHLE